MSRCTTFARSLVKTTILMGSIALTAIPAAPTLAASGPSQVLYIFPGVSDFGAFHAGVATAAHCFSFSPTTETIQITVRSFAGGVFGNASINIDQFHTATIVTHETVIYPADISLATGPITQGVMGIAATSTNIVCTAMAVDASAGIPSGVALHGTRFNPISGSQE